MPEVQAPPAETEDRDRTLLHELMQRREERSRRRHHRLWWVLLGMAVVAVAAIVYIRTSGNMSMTAVACAVGVVVMLLAVRRTPQRAALPTGRPVTTPDSAPAPPSQAQRDRRRIRNDARHGPIGPPLLRGPHGVQFITVAVVVAVVAGPLTAGAAVVVAARANARPMVASAASGLDPGPGAFAADCVKLVLRAGEDKRAELKDCYGSALPDFAGVPSGSFDATTATARQVSQLAPGYWSVLVAVDQVERVTTANNRNATWQPLGLRYYKLGVARRGGQLVAVGLPAPVAAPPAADPPDLAVASLEQPDPADPRTDRLSRFFGAFLANAGALDDSVLPGKQAAPIDPPPYSTVTLRAVGYDTDPAQPAANARVLITATTEFGNVQILGYSVRMLREEGRWYVGSLDGAPALTTG